MNYRVPTIEEIYNQYHRETIFAMKGFYPKSIKNFDKILTQDKIEHLVKFQNVVKRNYDMLDWKLYVKACAQYFKRNFDLKVLGSLQGNKIYRIYVSYENTDKTDEDIKNEILDSLNFIKIFCEENSMKISEYLLDRNTSIPISLKHLYSGSVSDYFYTIFEPSQAFKIFKDIPDDIFYELFKCSRDEFLENNISSKRESVLKSVSLSKFINIISNKFKNAV